ncbi:hypothetical protein KR026_002747, partial [Drosophila bipectinata]
VRLRQQTAQRISRMCRCVSLPGQAVLLGTALINVCHLGRTVQARALIDSGSEATFITERLFNLVKPPFKTIQAQVSGLNQTISAQSTKLCHFSIRSPSRPGLQLETAAYVLPQLAGNLPSYPIPRDPDIPLADPNFFESSQVDVLLGSDILPSILLGNSKANICGSLLGQETIFGWVLTGPLSPANPRSVSVFFARVGHSLGDSLDQGDVPTQISSESDSGCEHNSVSTPCSIYASHPAARWQSADDPSDPGQILDSKVIFSTMSPRPRSAQSLKSRCIRGTQTYRCRVCSGIHPLRKCRRFLRLSAEKRLRAVLVNPYCSSCLAHEHFNGSCRRVVEKPRARRQPRLAPATEHGR